MSTYNIFFHGEMRKLSRLLVEKKKRKNLHLKCTLSGAKSIEIRGSSRDFSVSLCAMVSMKGCFRNYRLRKITVLFCLKFFFFFFLEMCHDPVALKCPYLIVSC